MGLPVASRLPWARSQHYDAYTPRFHVAGRYSLVVKLGLWLALTGVSFLSVVLAQHDMGKALAVASAPMFAIIAFSVPRIALVGSLFLVGIVNVLIPFPINPGFFVLAILYLGIVAGAIRAPFRPLDLSSVLPFWYIVWQILLFVFISLPKGTTFGIPDMAAHFVILLAVPLAATLAPKTDDLLKAIAIVSVAFAWGVFNPDELIGGRPIAFAQDANSLGILCAQGIAASVTLAFRKQPMWLLAAAPCTWAVLHTGSRGSLMATAAAVTLPFLFQRRFLHLGLVGLIALSAVLIFPKQLSLEALLNGRTEEQQKSSTDARAEVYKQAIDYTIESPLVGVGPGRFAEVIQQRASLRGGIYVSHNDYLGVAAEGGLPSLFVLLAIFTVPLIIARRDKKIAEDFRALSPQVFIVAIGFMTINLLHDPATSLPASLSLGTLWASHLNRDLARTTDPED